MEKPRTTRRVNRRTLGVAIAFALTMIGGIAFVVTPDTDNTVKSAMCDTQAVKQLPPSVVKTVEGNQRAFNVPTMDAKNSGKDVAVRKIDANWNASAFIGFLPQYCGYVGNINNFPTNKTAESGDAFYAYDAAEKDRVIVIKNSTQRTAYDNTICIGNSPPTVRYLNNGGIEMTIYCDRSYKSGTWTQNVPVLVLVK